MADDINTVEDPSISRAEIEMTRARMSGTIDEIEDALLRRKERVQERLDFMAPVRERPLVSAGVALGAGLVLGLLTGGGDDDGEEWTDRHAHLHDADRRADKWETRAQRLLRIAREQEVELDMLRHRRGARGNHGMEDGTGDSDGSLRDRLMDGVSNFINNSVRDMFSR
jgi:ElaB/YqjD/DUF883 family membrane-anchored ribosome-binding protein